MISSPSDRIRSGCCSGWSALPSVSFIRGNTDRYVVCGDVPEPYPEEAFRDPSLLPRVIEIARNFTWTQGCVAGAGWLDWLAALPLEHRIDLPGGRRLLAVHGSPGDDGGRGLPPSLTDEELDALVADAEADIVCVGHTHDAFARRTPSGVLVINPGSISNPKPPDLRASYAILDGDVVTHRRVDYDREQVIEQLRRVRHPAADFLIGLQHGRHPAWD